MLPLPESRHCRRTRCADMLLVVFIGDTPRLQDIAALKIIMRGLEYFRGPEDPCSHGRGRWFESSIAHSQNSTILIHKAFLKRLLPIRGLSAAAVGDLSRFQQRLQP
jgi:hypothetical protein